ISSPVLPDPAGASTIHDCLMSSALSRSLQSGGLAASLWSAGSASVPTTNNLVTLCLRCLIVIHLFFKCRCIHAAQQSLSAPGTGSGKILWPYPRIAVIKILGQRSQHATPLFHLSFETCRVLPRHFDSCILAGGESLQAHIFSCPHLCERHRPQLRCLGQHSIQRQLRGIGPLGEPIAWTCQAGLVVDDDLSIRADIDSIYPYTQAQRPNPHVPQRLLAELHFKRRSPLLKFEPGPQ